MNLGVIFLTGLTVGGLTCLAVQGGLLASVIAGREEEDLATGNQRRHNLLPTTSFLTMRFLAHVLIGALLGAAGSIVSLTDTARMIVQIIAGLYMLAVALNLLEVHPVFRYVIIQPPRSLARLVHNQTKRKDMFAPGLLGLFTIFIPCGTTLAMEALAISSGSFVSGALILGAFNLGTIPLFFGIGVLTTVLGDAFRKHFLRIAALALIYLGLTTVNAGLVLAGSPITFQSLAESWQSAPDRETILPEQRGTIIEGVQVFTIRILNNGYSPKELYAVTGMPIRLHLETNETYACTVAFTIPELGLSRWLKPTGTDVIEFTPTRSGNLVWTCSMGMYRGVIHLSERL